MPEETAASRSLANLLRGRFDAIVSQMLERIPRDVDSPYATIPLEALRPRITGGLETIILDFEEAEPRHFTQFLQATVANRIREGFKVTDMLEPIRVSEIALQDFFRDTLSDPGERIVALERSHAIFSTTGRALLSAYVSAREAFLRDQLDVVNQISSPILPIYTGVLVMPLVGAVDRRRADQIMHTLLKSVGDHRAEVVIIDITGVPSLDESAASCLSDSARAVRLLGAEVVLVGISPAIAQAMLVQRIDVSEMQTRATLQAGLVYALARRGLLIGPRGAALPA
jgi:rsbT co-antagonist protein RsbR